MKLTYLFGLFILVGCTENNGLDAIQDDIKDTVAKQIPEIIEPDSASVISGSEIKYSFETFETPGAGWGYDIYEYGKLFIHQPHIPAVQGNKGFSSMENAEKTAEFAITKMLKGIVPPSISTEELDSLGVLQ